MIEPGGKFTYEFTVNQNGTFFYHSHGAMQEMLGMIGLFVSHPKTPHTPHVDKDYGIILQEWALLPNNNTPNTLAMEFNWLTMNGKAAPATTPLIIKQGERVRIRLVNLGMDHHPIHLHGHQFYVTGTEGGRMPETCWYPGNCSKCGMALVKKRAGIALSEADRKKVPGYPQDMMMAMDDEVAKPETWGLAPGWTASMMGMMTLVRVLLEDKYTEIMARIKAGQTARPKAAPEHQHHEE